MSETPIDVVMVGQRPPPTHGQAVANAILMDADYERLRVHPVPMQFSTRLEDVSQPSARKVLELFRVLGRIWRLRLNGHRDVLFWSVGLRNRIGLYRDLVLLPITRPLFGATVFHVHTGGAGALIDELPAPLRTLARYAYGDADAVIYLDPYLLEGDPGLPAPRHHTFVPYGVAEQPTTTTDGEDEPDVPLILFLGNLYETKGTTDLLQAAGRLHDCGHDFRMVMAGGSPDATAVPRLEEQARQLGIAERVSFPGHVQGTTKADLLARADVFCFPTRFEAEGMPLVILEAMSAGLPVVTTRWRAIPGLIRDGHDGVLVEPGDTEQLAQQLATLCAEPERRRRLGVEARRTYEDRHSIPQFVGSVATAIEQAEVTHPSTRGATRPVPAGATGHRRPKLSVAAAEPSPPRVHDRADNG